MKKNIFIMLATCNLIAFINIMAMQVTAEQKLTRVIRSKIGGNSYYLDQLKANKTSADKLTQKGQAFEYKAANEELLSAMDNFNYIGSSDLRKKVTALTKEYTEAFDTALEYVSKLDGKGKDAAAEKALRKLFGLSETK